MVAVAVSFKVVLVTPGVTPWCVPAYTDSPGGFSGGMVTVARNWLPFVSAPRLSRVCVCPNVTSGCHIK